MHVFLDLDGTLTDPKPGITKSVAYALQKLGLPVPPLDELTWVIGPALLDSFTQLGAADPQAALDLYRERYTDVGLFENSVYSGIPDTLAKMREMGFTLHLATAKPHKYATKITAHFGLTPYFQNEFGPELDGTRNDKGDLLKYALAQTGIDPEQAIMVGDRVHDYEAAKRVGMRSVAVTWGFGNGSEYAGANRRCDAVVKLADLLLEMSTERQNP